MGQDLSAVAVGEGSIWVGDLAGAVGRIDPATNSAIASIPVGALPTDVAVGEGSVWATLYNEVTVVRIDPRTNSVVATLDVGRGPAGVAVGEGSVWVSTAAGLEPFTPEQPTSPGVVRLDPVSGEVVARIGVRGEPSSIAVGEGSVWVVTGEAVTRIDPGSNQVTDTIPVSEAADIGVGEGSVWVAGGGSGAMIRIDPERSEVAETIPLGRWYVQAVAVGEGSTWAVGMDGWSESVSGPEATTWGVAWRVDPATAKATVKIPIGDPVIQPSGRTSPLGRRAGIAIDGRSSWITLSSEGDVTRIDWRPA